MPKILVAHQSASTRRDLCRALARAGFEVIEAASGVDARDGCREGRPHAAVVEAELPGHDGVSVLTALRAESCAQELPVILLRQGLDPEKVLEAVREGAHGQLREPVDPGELVAMVHGAVRARHAESEARDRRGQLEQFAFADVLTGLPNRRLLSERLAGMLAAARRHDRCAAVAMLDVDGFKTINDSLGHGAGDAVLVTVAQRLCEAARTEDVVGRWAGDEFLVLLPDADADGAARAGERFRAAVAGEEAVVDGVGVRLSASVGWAVWRGEPPDDLVAEADVGLYRAKRAGRDCVRGNVFLSDVPPQLLPNRLAGEAERLAHCPAALYAIELEGKELKRVAGSDALPDGLAIGQLFGCEMAEIEADEVERAVRNRLPNAGVAPLWYGGRAVTVLVTRDPPRESLEALVREGAPAMELATQATDVIHRARRIRRTTPGAELQQDLLPAPVGRFVGAELAASVLPAYEVGGDWFDWSQNAHDAFFSLGDGIGSGAHAMLLAALALSASRAARRDGDGVEGIAQTAHQAIVEGGDADDFVTAILACWRPSASLVTWVNMGHPPPLLFEASGQARELTGGHPPLGVQEGSAALQASRCQLVAGQRLVLYSDGVSERRDSRGRMFGRAGIEEAARTCSDRSAAGTVRAVLRAVLAFSDEPVDDDATMLALVPTGVRPA